jgi:hypothetical protein
MPPVISWREHKIYFWQTLDGRTDIIHVYNVLCWLLQVNTCFISLILCKKTEIILRLMFLQIHSIKQGEHRCPSFWQSVKHIRINYIFLSFQNAINFAHSSPICSIINSKVHICIVPYFMVHTRIDRIYYVIDLLHDLSATQAIYVTDVIDFFKLRSWIFFYIYIYKCFLLHNTVTSNVYIPIATSQ